jgi:hypothetical protein
MGGAALTKSVAGSAITHTHRADHVLRAANRPLPDGLTASSIQELLARQRSPAHISRRRSCRAGHARRVSWLENAQIRRDSC